MEQTGRLKKHLGGNSTWMLGKERESRITLLLWFKLFRVDDGTTNGERIESWK